jgi:hypothetical protein
MIERAVVAVQHDSLHSVTLMEATTLGAAGRLVH